MRAIILSAGQGRRLLPLTEESPKCLLEVQDGVSILAFQLRTLAACGVRHASVIAGFSADRVEESLCQAHLPGIATRVVYNPFYRSSDNLVTAWVARHEMREDFLLLNGDTLFEPAALARLLDAPPAPLTLAIDRKEAYDDDDMKVEIDDTGRLLAIGKRLPRESVRAESIGMMLFRGEGPASFRLALEAAIREPGALRLWYLSVVDSLVDSMKIRTRSVQGLWWSEIDSPGDLSRVRADLARLEAQPAAESGTASQAG
jgi:choline kinase